MSRRILVAALGIMTSLSVGASAQVPDVVAVTPGYPPGTQLPGAPYTMPGYTIYPFNSTALPPQFSHPAYNRYPAGAQTCVASGFTCPASAPNTPGLPCTCRTQSGDTLAGVVH